MTARRRRGLLLLSIALASGGLAASQVQERERKAAEGLGPTVEVLVAARDLPAGARLASGAAERRTVPARFVPPDALASQAGLSGARIAVTVSAGSYLTAGMFDGDGGDSGEGLREGERAVTVEVAGGSGVAGLPPGTRVDVLVSTEGRIGGGRTVMALGGAELLGLGEAVGAGAAGGLGGAGEDAETAAASGVPALATLRVSLRQAIYLTAADNFAREIRLLARPRGDNSRAGDAVSQGQL